MLEIDKLRYNWEIPFLNLMKETEKNIGNCNKITYHIGDLWYFVLNERWGYFNYSQEVLKYFQKNYKNYTSTDSEHELILKYNMEKYFNIKILGPVKTI